MPETSEQEALRRAAEVLSAEPRKWRSRVT